MPFFTAVKNQLTKDIKKVGNLFSAPVLRRRSTRASAKAHSNGLAPIISTGHVVSPHVETTTRDTPNAPPVNSAAVVTGPRDVPAREGSLSPPPRYFEKVFRAVVTDSEVPDMFEIMRECRSKGEIVTLQDLAELLEYLIELIGGKEVYAEILQERTKSAHAEAELDSLCQAFGKALSIDNNALDMSDLARALADIEYSRPAIAVKIQKCKKDKPQSVPTSVRSVSDSPSVASSEGPATPRDVSPMADRASTPEADLYSGPPPMGCLARKAKVAVSRQRQDELNTMSALSKDGSAVGPATASKGATGKRARSPDGDAVEHKVKKAKIESGTKTKAPKPLRAGVISITATRAGQLADVGGTKSVPGKRKREDEEDEDEAGADKRLKGHKGKKVDKYHRVIVL